MTLLGWTVSLAISYTSTPIYRAEASLIVFPNANLTSSRDVVTSLDTLDKRSITSTYEDILNSDRVFQETVKALNMELNAVRGYRRFTVVQQDSNTIYLDVEGPDPFISAKLANGIGENSIRYIKGIYQVFDISFLDQAVPPQTHVYPQALRDGGIAAGSGFLLGIILAILIDIIRAPFESYRRRSMIDKITGAFTQRHFKHLLDQEIAENPSEPLSLARLDLEGLLELVDVIPEKVLSDLMHNVTETLLKQLRGNDAIGKWNASGYILLLKSTPGSAATRTMERIRQVLAEPIKVESLDEALSLLPCIGLAERIQEDEPSNLIIERAETALQQARQSDKKTVYYAGSTGEV